MDQIGAAGHTDVGVPPAVETGQLVAAGVEEVDEVAGKPTGVAEERRIGVLEADAGQPRARSGWPVRVNSHGWSRLFEVAIRRQAPATRTNS